MKKTLHIATLKNYVSVKIQLKVWLILGLCTCGVFMLEAQELSRQVFSPAGTYYAGTTVYYSFTIGEPVVSSYISSTGKKFLTHGFEQSPLHVLGIKNLPDYSEIKVYPNPGRQHIFIETQKLNVHKISIHIYDISGHEVLSGQPVDVLNDTKIKVGLQDLAKGPYLINIVDNQSGVIVSRSKIIKIY